MENNSLLFSTCQLGLVIKKIFSEITSSRLHEENNRLLFSITGAHDHGLRYLWFFKNYSSIYIFHICIHIQSSLLKLHFFLPSHHHKFVKYLDVIPQLQAKLSKQTQLVSCLFTILFKNVNILKQTFKQNTGKNIMPFKLCIQDW